ncbi:MAG: hypothetical protein K0V04_00470 [Deltaproteobacteria bacterium]|nr:hypothetical protein [Deltaproteobacteria bacterium]
MVGVSASLRCRRRRGLDIPSGSIHTNMDERIVMMNNTNGVRTFGLVLLLGLASFGCDADTVEFDEGLELELDETVENLLAAGYGEDEIELSEDEQVVVDDAVVTLQASRGLAEVDDPPSNDGIGSYSTEQQTLSSASFCDEQNGRTIALRTAHNRYMRAGSGNEGWAIDQLTYIGTWEEFTVVCDGADVSLRTAHGRYLRAGNVNEDWRVNQQSFIGPWERLTAVPLGDGIWAFRTAHNRYLRAAFANENWEIDQLHYIGTWERFTIVPRQSDCDVTNVVAGCNDPVC